MDTSTTIYTLTSQVEDLKKIYKGEVLPLEEYIDGIEQVKLRQPSSISFDLQGRRLNDKPSKGIYIQNGKKVVIKWANQGVTSDSLVFVNLDIYVF